MTSILCRGSIAWAAVVVALLSSRPADAQVGFDPGPPREPGGLVNNLLTGVQYDIWNQAKAEHRLQHVQEKLRRDAERCDSAAADRDARRIENLKYRIVVDEWLIRQNSLYNPGCYPHTLRMDPITCDAIAQAASPAQFPYHPQPALPPGPIDTYLLTPTPTPGLIFPSGLTPIPGSTYSSQPASTPGPMAAARTISIAIVNAEPAGGAGIAFAIDGVAYQAAGGSRQDLTVAPGSNITYDGGGSLGQRRYSISPGLYEFRSTPEGWALYKLPAKP
jgi:hypothetical protein